AEAIPGCVQRSRAGDAAIGVRSVDKGCLESSKVFQIADCSQGPLNDKQCVVSRDGERVWRAASARLDRIRNWLPQILQRIGKAEGRAWIGGAGRESGCVGVASQSCGKRDTVTPIPMRGGEGRVARRTVKDADDFIEGSEIDCNAALVSAPAQQRLNLR